MTPGNDISDERHHLVNRPFCTNPKKEIEPFFRLQRQFLNRNVTKSSMNYYCQKASNSYQRYFWKDVSSTYAIPYKFSESKAVSSNYIILLSDKMHRLVTFLEVPPSIFPEIRYTEFSGGHPQIG